MKHQQLANWRSMSLNMVTCSEKYDDRLDGILQLAADKQIDLLGIQEFRRLGKDSRSIETEDGTKWDLYWSGFKTKREQGVAIAVRRSRKIQILQIQQVNPRIIWIEIQMAGMKIRVYSCYAPTNCPTKDHNAAHRAKFWKELQKESDSNHPKTEQLFLGDFNAWTDLVQPRRPTNFGRHKQYPSDFSYNENGEAITTFCAKNSLGMMNTYFYQKRVHQMTHHSFDGVTISIKDYALASQNLANHCNDCRVKNDYIRKLLPKCDHRCLVQRWATPLRRIDQPPRKKSTRAPALDCTHLQRESTRDEFLVGLDAKFSKIGNFQENLDEKTTQMCDELNSLATQTLPKRPRDDQNFPWRTDGELKRLKSARNRLNYTRDKAEFRSISKLIKKRADEVKQIFYQQKADAINLAEVGRDLEKVFRIAKNQGAFNQKALAPTACNKLKGHYQSHFNKQPPSPTPPPEITHPLEFLLKQFEDIEKSMENIDINAAAPDQDEIKQAILKLKRKKSSTDVPAELLQAAVDSPEALQTLTELYSEIWSRRSIPSDWNYSRLKALYKNKGDPGEAKNYRGLSVTSMLQKIMCMIILNRLQDWYELSLLEGQFGFRNNRGCQDAAYCLRRLQQVYHIKKQKLFVAFIDLKAAFDWVPRGWMFETIKIRNLSNSDSLLWLVELLEANYKETFSFMTGEEKADAFPTTSGVKQGASESPSLFVLYLDYILRIFEEECKKLKLGISLDYRIPNEATDRAQRRDERSTGLLWLMWLGFADDLGLLADSQEDLQKALELLHGLFEKFGLKLSLEKTETMVMSEAQENYPETICTLDGVALKNTETFTYLGQKFNYSEPYTAKNELLTRKFSGINGFFKEELFYKNHAVGTKTRRLVLDAMVRSKLTYCCQTWSTTAAAIKPIAAAYNQKLRCLVKGGTSRKMTPLNPDLEDDDEDQTFDMAYNMNNEQIYAYTGATNPVDFIEKQQVNWYGHIVRSSNKRIIKKLTFTDVKSKRTGQPLRTLQKFVEKKYPQHTTSQINKAAFDRKIHLLVE